ncbi:MAG TPA: methyl-accepting chemotaxis protein [Accumulibacter sp.]|uniref:methyl-accepting chemotaxis protein n=1 Tax=Accumulibacter sp. TaxID=2053492 RepID=UPI002588F7FF|nr:methyl-accepting chemotaxis protein [Accumulibacter sp.]MCM8623083.1 methyl-accepting chemotaxis protein [Accumulibacter sp.]HMW57741.1 methyl-accepting chemotaxis protein [Accumulibacter sp.]HNF92828.1 methyl-accepting chemotaxis protein [Accumulibacter sp.]HNM65816.1 methyl-accepting chemotaxis protein [Accumulibacter sp.]
MKIKTLLCSGFAAVCTVMAVQVVIAYWQLNLIDKAVDNIVRASRNESMSREIAERVNGMRRYELGALVTADERDQQLERATKAGKENTQLAEELEKYQRNPETRQIAANMRTLNERYVRSHEQAVAFGKEGSLDAMRDLIQGEARKAQRELAAESEKFIKIQQERKLQAEQAAEAAHELAEKLLIGLLLSGVAIAIGIALLVTRRITGQLGGEPEYARQLVQRIADGDLSQDLALQSGDTQSLMAHQQQMQLRLRTILKNIGSTVISTEDAAQTLAGSSQQVAAASRSASDSAASMAAVVEQMSVSISQVADNARDALKTASHAAELSDSGGGVIEQATSAINHIADTVRQTSEAMRTLEESAKRISTVVQVIKEVADQTNLLALNAAIEAARAGESGRGFAVVADEVRKLAERTGKATNEINNMVQQIQHETRNSLDSMETAVQQVDRGVELAGSAGEAIRDIRSSVDQVVSVVNDIGSAIQEQSIASQQIAQRVEQVAQTSEENNAAAEETASAARTLSDLAGGLRNTVAQFRT